MPGMAASAEAPAVDWQQEVSELCGSEQWRQLLSDLAGSAGGPTVAALLQRATAGLLAGFQGSSCNGGSSRVAAVSPGSSSGGGGSARLAQAVQQVVWEKLHTGDWHAVGVVWRDTYAAACILSAAAGLPGEGSSSSRQEKDQHQHAEHTAEAAAQATRAGSSAVAALGAAGLATEEAAALSSALWHLDMAAIMGGGLLRRRVDALIASLQRRWQKLHAAAAAASQRQQQRQQLSGPAGEPAAKRQRVGTAAAGGEDEEDGSRGAEGSSREGSIRAFHEQREAAAVAAAAAADAVFLPPWSLGPRGSPIATAHLPSLETFWRDYMSRDTPVVISGAMEDWPALERWADPQYLVRVAGPRTVPIEVGEHYLAEQWGQQLMTLQQFVQRHLLGGGGGGGSGDNSAGRVQTDGADRKSVV